MDFNQIRYFLALADTLNFTSAAEHCHVTQPGLTNAIKKLEDELGGALIHRDGRNTRLTELGKTLRAQFENIDSLKRQIKSAANLFRSGKTAEINVGIMCTIGPGVLSGFLDSFQEEHPGLTLYLHDVPASSMPNLLKSGALDVGFYGRNGAKQPSLDYAALFAEDMIVAFPADHPFAERNTVRLIDIAHERYLDRLGCEFRNAFLTFVEEHQVELDVAFASEREDWIQVMIQTGVGVGIMPRYSVPASGLSFRPISEPTLNRSVDLVVAKTRASNDVIDALIAKASAYDWQAALLG